MPLAYQSIRWAGIVRQSSIGWGPSSLGVGADVRLIAGLEAGLGVSYALSRSEMHSSQASTIQSTTTQSGFGTTPRIGYRIALSPDLDIVPRVGLRFTHSTFHMTAATTDGTTAPETDSSGSATWSTFGVLLQARLAGPIFAAVGPELSVRLGGSTETISVGPSTTTETPDIHAFVVGLLLGVGTRF